MPKTYPLICAFASAVLLGTQALAHDAHDEALFGRPSRVVFQPYRPYRDGAIVYPGRRGPVPVHVRVYGVPVEPPYYNVPPYIVLDP